MFEYTIKEFEELYFDNDSDDKLEDEVVINIFDNQDDTNDDVIGSIALDALEF